MSSPLHVCQVGNHLIDNIRKYSKKVNYKTPATWDDIHTLFINIYLADTVKPVFEDLCIYTTDTIVPVL